VTIAGPLVIAQKYLRFRIQRQQESEWCWAAVAASVDHYFDPQSTLEQCDVASKTLPVEYPPDPNNPNDPNKLPPSDCGCCCQCCCDPDSCDKPTKLEIALQKVNKWRNTLFRPLTFEEVQREIDHGRPIGVGIKWQSGGTNGGPATTGHFVAIRGYRLLSSGACQLYIADPLLPSRIVPFEEFTVAYDGDGEWVETHLVQNGYE
jgi:hypothetical protein